MKLLYKGKAKEIYQTDIEGQIAIVYTDNATAGNGEKADSFANKGKLNAEISSLIYKHLEANGVKTHLIENKLEQNMQICHHCELVPLEVIIRNITAGSMAKKMGIEEGIKLSHPIFELSYKDDSLGDPFINSDYATSLGICSKDELTVIKEAALTINQLLIELFLAANITVVDFKLEFGRRNDGEVVLIDEISPDTMRLWDVTTNQKMDKDNFRRDLGDLVDNYNQVLNRLKETNV
ncbi:phosphoribosylaminoimidazolesuccinocarboxamide synthase [Mollicutes bacterium LVI A0078]|nr:phosphoribosylaminoimidazolesuccinocarboxamide synthase [Mollicutes bacterium LVI A0075]WOO91525.1 phosphoribosylaminoimidazolesuccinocarboxamide synthase [Mollicutes bacterium LVI A0078]